MRCQILRPFHLIGVALILAAGVIAGPPPITITDRGIYATIVDDAGVPSFVRVTDVTDLRTGDTMPPIVSDDPDEDPPTELAPPPEGISQDAAVWALEAGGSDGAQVYALIFETVRDGVTDDTIAPADVFRVLRESANALVDDRWESFRRKLGDYLTELSQEGKLETKEQVANQLELIRYGVGYSAKDSESISSAGTVEVVAKVLSIIDGEGE